MDAGTPSLISVNLATVAIESLLYGAFLVLSVTFLYLHFSRAGSQRAGGTPSLSAYVTPVLLGSTLVISTVSGVSFGFVELGRKLTTIAI